MIGLTSPNSNPINATDTNESAASGELVAKYRYKFYVQDENSVPANESERLGLLGETLLDPSDPDSYVEVEDSLDTSVAPLPGAPREMELSLPSLARPDEGTFLQHSRLVGPSGVAGEFVDTVSISEEEKDALVDIVRRSFDAKRRRGATVSELINFEESLTIGTIDVSDVSSDVVQSLEATMRLRDGNTDPAASAISISSDSVADGLESALATPEFIDKVGSSVNSSRFRLLPVDEDEFEASAPLTQQLGYSFSAITRVAANVIKRATSPSPFSLSQGSTAKSLGRSSISELRREVNGLPVLDSSVRAGESSVAEEPASFQKEIAILTEPITSLPFDLVNKYFVLPPGTRSKYAVVPCGFIVRRVDLGRDGQTDTAGNAIPDATDARPPVFFTPDFNSRTTTITDSSVIHRHRYVYEARILNAVFFSVAGEEGPGYFLVASRPLKSGSSSVTTKSNRILSPPVDLEFTYNRENPSLLVDWSYPVIPRRPPIARFLVFRRRNIREPFALLKAVEVTKREPVLKRYVGEERAYFDLVPTSLYEDDDFGMKSDFIYAIACEDVDGNISNYSQQFRVRYSQPEYGIIVSLVSTSGAPLQFPNFFLTTAAGGLSDSRGSTTIVDSVIKVSGNRKLLVSPTYGRRVTPSGPTDRIGTVNVPAGDEMESIEIVDRDAIYTINVISLTDESSTNIDFSFT